MNTDTRLCVCRHEKREHWPDHSKYFSSCKICSCMEFAEHPDAAPQTMDEFINLVPPAAPPKEVCYMNTLAIPWEEAVRMALDELGEPQPEYPAPVANAIEILRNALSDNPIRNRLPAPPSDAAPVAWRYKHGFHEDRRTLWLYTERDPALLGDHDTQPLYAHPEDALKQTPETFSRSGDVKGDLHPEDAPGGPWEVSEEIDGWFLFRNDSYRSIRGFGNRKTEAIAVRDALNRFKGEESRLQILEAQRELTAADVAFPIEDGTYSLLLSDTFSYACADAEKIPDDDVIRLAQLYKDHGWDALMVWAEDRRGQRVIEPLRKQVDEMRDRLKGETE